jgi:hypothetical protein
MTAPRQPVRLTIHRMVECPFQCDKLVSVDNCLECAHQVRLDSKKGYVDCRWRADWDRHLEKQYPHTKIEEVK